MQFEVEVYRDDDGRWVANAVQYGVTAAGLTEKEALAKIMEALSAHFKKQQAQR